MAKQGSTKSKRSKTQEAKTPPRLFHWKKPEKRKFRYERAFNRAELLPVGAALVLFMAACLAPVGPLLKLIAFAVTAAGILFLITALSGYFSYLQLLKYEKTMNGQNL